MSSSEVFGIRVEAGDSFCNCFACDFHGKQSDVLLEMRRLNKSNPVREYPFGELLQLISEAEDGAELDGLNAPGIEEVLFNPRKPLHIYPEWWLKSFPKATDIKWAMDYLKTGRPGCDPIPDDIIEYLDIRADSSDGRVCFPIRDFNEQLVGLHGRSVVEGVEPRYRMYLQQGEKNVIVWHGEQWVDFEKPVVVVEGPFDLASVMRVYPNVVTPLYSNPNEAKLRRMGGVEEWYTLLDRGTGGNKGREKFSKVLGGTSVVNHLEPPKGAKDPGNMTRQQLVELLGPHVKILLP